MVRGVVETEFLLNTVKIFTMLDTVYRFACRMPYSSVPRCRKEEREWQETALEKRVVETYVQPAIADTVEGCGPGELEARQGGSSYHSVQDICIIISQI